MPDKKIRLFVDAHPLDKEFQGTQTFICGLYNGLMKKYSDCIDIYFGTNNMEKIKNEFPWAARDNILPYNKSRSRIFRLLTDVPYYIKKYKFDFAHFQNISSVPVLGVKNIVTLHDIIFDDFPDEFPLGYKEIRNFLFKRSLRQATIKTSVSDYSRQRISKRYNITSDEISIIPNGVARLFGECNLSRVESKKRVKLKFGFEDFILSVGRIEPRKNHLLLLDKYLRLELYNKGISLVFVGKRSIEVPELRKRIDSLADDQRKMFYWIEQVDQIDLGALYKASRLFVYPSKAEGFGIPPLEAAACGSPVLCSNTTAMRDFSFFAPYVFDPDDQEQFETKLSTMITTPPDKDHIDKVALAVSENYSWESSADILYKLLIKYKK
jgi:glycosyltransferase involved in cell wall biosynthesis